MRQILMNLIFCIFFRLIKCFIFQFFNFKIFHYCYFTQLKIKLYRCYQNEIENIIDSFIFIILALNFFIEENIAHMFWILFGIIFVCFFILTLWKFGLFERFQMQKRKLMRCQILYLPYTGEYSKIGPLFEEVSKDTRSVFTFSQNFGFYFDDPSTTVPQRCRSIVGVIVNQGQEFKIRQFLQKYPGYKRSQLDTTRYLSYQMPFINILSILLMVKTVYPKIQEYVKKNEVNQQDTCGIMELYKCVPSDKKIQILLPLENKNQFLGLIQSEQIKERISERHQSVKRQEVHEQENYEQENKELMREE